jgi:hypothetical protein
MNIPGRGIGMVSVHPYSRSSGFMKALMNMALEDMKQDGVIFSGLGGQRQRYEYFGYTPAGLLYRFECSKTNIRHFLGREFKSGLAIKKLESNDTEFLEAIRRMHESKAARLQRRQDRFFDIISSWRSSIWAITEGRRFMGYLIYNPGDAEIAEINLEDLSRSPEVIGLFLEKGNYGASGNAERVRVVVQPQETEKTAVFSRFAEDFSQSSAYSFNILDFPRFVLPFLKLKSSYRTLPDGKFALEIENGPVFSLGVSNGEPSLRQASLQEAKGKADLCLPHLEAMRFLFSAETAAAAGGTLASGAGLAVGTAAIVARSPFLQSLLPLPLSFESTDGV